MTGLERHVLDNTSLQIDWTPFFVWIYGFMPHQNARYKFSALDVIAFNIHSWNHFSSLSVGNIWIVAFISLKETYLHRTNCHRHRIAIINEFISTVACTVRLFLQRFLTYVQLAIDIWNSVLQADPEYLALLTGAYISVLANLYLYNSCNTRVSRSSMHKTALTILML